MVTFLGFLRATQHDQNMFRGLEVMYLMTKHFRLKPKPICAQRAL